MRVNQRIKSAAIIVLFFAFLFFLNLSSIPKGIKSFFYSLSEPAQNFLWGSGSVTSNFLETIFESQSIRKENEQLKIMVLELLAENLKLRDEEEENMVLREALNLGIDKDFNIAISKVIGKDLSQDSIVIDKGSNDGITKDLVVMTEQKVLVGRVSEVYDNFSRVILLSNKESLFDAQVENIDGLMRGHGNLKAFLELIPKEKEVVEGDIVTTSYLSGKYPSGLLIGQVKSIEKQDPELFQTAEIDLFFDIGKTKTLFIVTNF